MEANRGCRGPAAKGRGDSEGGDVERGRLVLSPALALGLRVAITQRQPVSAFALPVERSEDSWRNGERKGRGKKRREEGTRGMYGWKRGKTGRGRGGKKSNDKMKPSDEERVGEGERGFPRSASWDHPIARPVCLPPQPLSVT